MAREYKKTVTEKKSAAKEYTGGEVLRNPRKGKDDLDRGRERGEVRRTLAGATKKK